MNLTEMKECMKNACFEEITHLICDADKKVNITFVSNNWNLSHRDSETILLDWIKKNDCHTLSKEFLIRGIEKNGNCVITVLAEKKLDAVQKKFSQMFTSLYSIELASKSQTNRLNVAKLSDCKVINLPLKNRIRDVIVKPLPVPQIEKAASAKNHIQTMFGTSKSATKPDVTTENISPGKVEIKSEKETPKKSSPKKKEPIKTPKLAPTIASFFSKPAANLKSKQSDMKKETASPPIIKESTINSSDMFDDQCLMDVDENHESLTETKTKDLKKESVEKSRKRSITDVDNVDDNDVIPNTPQDRKKVRRSTKKSSKHARIMKIEDSSDDEDGQDEKITLPASPIKEKENKTPLNRTRKAKKMVARTYEDEDGYLVTKNEMVEFSCSDEENVDVPAEPIKQVKEVSEKSPEKSSKKKKISPTNAGKQGSILSFFSKK